MVDDNAARISFDGIDLSGFSVDWTAGNNLVVTDGAGRMIKVGRIITFTFDSLYPVVTTKSGRTFKVLARRR